jgi:NarL family two-component system response regulator LiaR
MKTLLLYFSNPMQERLLGRVLEEQDGFNVVCCDRRKALALAPGAEIAIVEEERPAETSSFVRELASANPEIGIVIIRRGGDPLPYLEAGAMDCLDSQDGTQEILAHARAVSEGQSPLEPGLVGRVVRRLQELSQLCADQGVELERCATLSPRETEVTGLLARGRTNEEIAADLGVALGTIKTHVHNILRKLDVENRRQAGAYWRLYRRHGADVGAGNGGQTRG